AGHYYDTCQLRSTGGKAVDRWVKARISSIQIGNDVRRAAHRLVKDQAQRQMADFNHRRNELLAAQKRHQEDRKKLARGLNAEIIPPDVYRQLEEDEAAALKVIGQEMATLEMPRTADLGPVLEALSSLTWETLDNEAWREVVALLIQRVAVYGLNNYRLTWSDTGTALREALQTVS